MDVPTRLKQLMSRSAVRLPSQHDPAQYTAEVMERVRAVEQPATAEAPVVLWRTRPRLGLATALAAALLAITILPQRHAVRMARQIDQEAALLLAVDEPVPNGGDEGLAEELETLDAMMLAEAGAANDDAAWLEDTVQLLDELEDDSALQDDDPASDDEESWLEELELMDSSDLATSS